VDLADFGGHASAHHKAHRIAIDDDGHLRVTVWGLLNYYASTNLLKSLS
jgi:hypothetical protein